MTDTPRDLVLQFWHVMQSNDFHAAAQRLSPDFEGVWPQSGEMIRGRENFASLNTAYPAKGRWHFTVNRCVAEGDAVVTDVTITDGDIVATAITFHTVKNDQITRQVEYWPDPYDPPAWRAQWVELTKEPGA